MLNHTPRKPAALHTISTDSSRDRSSAGTGKKAGVADMDVGSSSSSNDAEASSDVDVAEEFTTVSLDKSPSRESTGSGDPNSSSIFTLTADQEDEEREQRLLYLRQAFCRFFKAQAGVEMENLGRVICAILGLTEDEKTMVMESISKIAPAVAVSSTFDSVTSAFENLFA